MVGVGRKEEEFSFLALFLFRMLFSSPLLILRYSLQAKGLEQAFAGATRHFNNACSTNFYKGASDWGGRGGDLSLLCASSLHRRGRTRTEHRKDWERPPPMWPGHKSGRQRNRPTSGYPPSLHALKDWWDKSGITWFLRGQTSDKTCQCKKSRSSLFILNNRTWRTFYLEDDNGNLWVKISPPPRVKMIIVTFLEAVATVRCPQSR